MNESFHPQIPYTAPKHCSLHMSQKNTDLPLTSCARLKSERKSKFVSAWDLLVRVHFTTHTASAHTISVWSINCPGGVLAVCMTGGPTELFVLTWAWKFTSKKYLASKFSTQTSTRLSTSILIYSIKQTLRPKKNTWQIFWPKKNTESVNFQPSQKTFPSCILQVPPPLPLGLIVRKKELDCKNWKITETYATVCTRV